MGAFDGYPRPRPASARTREQGLAALLADVLSADRPAPELLVRYARDAASLNSQERAEIEHALAHLPGYRAELAVLRRMLALPH